MLQNIREHTQGWIASIIGVLLSMAFALWGIEYYLVGGKNKDTAVKVNGVAISNQKIDIDYKRLVSRYIEQYGASILSNQLLQRQIKQIALQNFITREVLAQAANRAGFRVDVNQAGAMIQQMPEFQVGGRFSLERFQRILSQMGYSDLEFVNELGQSLLLNQVASGLIGSSFVLPKEITTAWILSEQRRDIFLAVVPVSRFLNNVSPSKEAINQYYQSHQDEFRIPAKVSVEYVQLNSEEIKKSLQISDAELKEYYEANFNSSIQNKNDFEKSKAKIALALRQQKTEQTFSSQSDKLVDLAFTNPNTLQPIANDLNLEIKTTELFTQSGGNTPMTKNPKVINEAFNQDILNGNNSKLIEISPGNVIILRVKKYQPESIRSFSEAENTIRQVLIKDLAAKKVTEQGEKIVTEIQKNGNVKTQLEAQHLTVNIKNGVHRHESNINPLILQLAFQLPVKNNKPTVTGTILPNGDYVIVGVSKLYNENPNNFTPQQKAKYQKYLANTYSKYEYSLYVGSQMRKAKIKFLSS